MSITIDLQQLEKAMDIVANHTGEGNAKLLTNLIITMQDLQHSAIAAAKHANAKNPEAQRITTGGVDIIKFDNAALATQMDTKLKTLLQKVGTISEPNAKQEIRDAILKITAQTGGGGQTTVTKPKAPYEPGLQQKTASNDPKRSPTAPHERRGNQ